MMLSLIVIVSTRKQFILVAAGVLASQPRLPPTVNDHSMPSATANVIQVGLGFFFLFVQFNSRGYIQETIFESIALEKNIDPHTGYNGLSVYYLVFTFANLFVSPVIDRLGIQWSMAIGAFLTMLYEIGFFSINVYYYYVTSVLSGIGAALIWPSMGTYLTQNSTEKTLERNSSIIWAMSQASQVVGGLILFAVFHSVGKETTDGISASAQFWTSIAFTASLGISFFVFLTLRQPPNKAQPIIFHDTSNFKEELLTTFKLMLTKRMALLGVVFAYTGIVQSFWTSIFPTCISFTEKLGDDNMTMMALSTSVAGIGQLILCGTICSIGKSWSRKKIVNTGLVCHLLVFAGVYLFFPPLSSKEKTDEQAFFPPNLPVTLLLSFLLGFGDGCWNTQVYAFVGDVFPHISNPAFALFNFYQSLMTAASLFYSSEIILSTHLIILAGSATVAAVCYTGVENMGRLDFDDTSIEKKNRSRGVKDGRRDALDPSTPDRTPSPLTFGHFPFDNQLSARMTAKADAEQSVFLGTGERAAERRALFNVIQIGVAFLLFFVQFNTRGYIAESVFANVAETTDIDPHAGYLGLAVYYLVFTISNLVISPLIDRLGLSLSMTVGTILTLLFEVGFFHINEHYYYFTSALAGFGAALIWPALGTYMTENSTEKNLERNSAIIWALSQASQIVGGFILLFVFPSSGGDSISNEATLGTSIVLTGFLILATIVFFTLRKAPPALKPLEKKETKPGLVQDLSSTFRLLATKRMALLAIVFAYTGIVQSFWTSIFPTCIFFTQHLSQNSMKWVAWSCIWAGVGQITVSFWTAFTPQISCLSRKAIVALGCLTHLVVFLGVYLYFPRLSSLEKTEDIGYFFPDPYVVMFLSFLLGFGDGCWNTQVYAQLADIFPHCSNEAFALFNFYQSLMASFSMVYSSYINLREHLYILILSATVGAVCFWIVEHWGKLSAIQEEEEEHDADVIKTLLENKSIE